MAARKKGAKASASKKVACVAKITTAKVTKAKKKSLKAADKRRCVRDARLSLASLARKTRRDFGVPLFFWGAMLYGHLH
jgi:hypothetical protein